MQNFAKYAASTPAPQTLTGAVPTITGTLRVGQTLKASVGVWKPVPIVLHYQWKRSGVAIAGATSASYKLTAADAGKTMSLVVTGSKSNFTTLARTSARTAAVAAQ